MHPDDLANVLDSLRAATRPGLDWPALYRFAVAAGCGQCVSDDEERIAAVDELLSYALPELVVLGELAASACGHCADGSARRALQDTTAGVVRLLDRALAADGREHRQVVEQWRRSAATSAHATAAFLEEDPEPPRGQLAGALERGARCIADALVAMPREPSTVPEHVAEAAGEFLVVFAAATE
jgi:hypothetical protein